MFEDEPDLLRPPTTGCVGTKLTTVLHPEETGTPQQPDRLAAINLPVPRESAFNFSEISARAGASADLTTRVGSNSVLRVFRRICGQN